MGKILAFGTRVRNMGIERVDVPKNAKVRAILLSPNVLQKFVWYDEARHKRVELTEELAIKLGVSPSSRYYYLVAQLNCDASGKILDDTVTVKYITMANASYNEFLDDCEENGNMTSILLTKVEKGGFSYDKVKPSNMEIPDAVLAKVKPIQENEAFIEKCFTMLDASTSITSEQYETLLADEGVEPAPTTPSNTPALPDMGAPASTPAIGAPASTPAPTPTPAP